MLIPASPSFKKWLGLALLAHLILALSFPPLPLGLSVFASLSIWFYALSQVSIKQGIWMSFMCGILLNAINYYWILETMKVGPAVVVALGLVGISCFLSLFTILQGYLFQKLLQIRFGLWLFPWAWAGIEVLRTWGELSFPWNHLAYTLGSWISGIQISSLIGVFGLGILILYTNLFLFRFIQKPHQKKWLISAIALVVFVFSFGHIRLANAHQSSEKATIALVQPSIPQVKKWGEAYYKGVIDSTWALIKRNKIPKVDLIVFPETAIPNVWSNVWDDQQTFKKFATEIQSDILVGALEIEHSETSQGNKRKIFNSAFWIDHTTLNVDRFNKNHLVPFSEKVPFNEYLPMINFVDLGQSDFTPGTQIPVWNEKIKWSPNICYESIYPQILRTMIQNGTRLMINITNDGWFGKSTQPGQHANLVIFRAVENAMPFARVANTGFSLIVDDYGRTLKQTQLFEKTVLIGSVPLRNKLTFYAIFGQYLEWLFIFALIIIVFFIKINTQKISTTRRSNTQGSK